MIAFSQLVTTIIILLLLANNYYGQKLVEMKYESDRLMNLAALKYINEYIMFWRPQKVGSSTLLSAILSFGYRYNIIPRSKGIRNSLCYKISKCALFNQTHLNSNKNLYYTDEFRKSTSFNLKNEGIFKIIESVRFSLSSNHEICNFHHEITQFNLQCAFEYRNFSDNYQGIQTSDKLIREIFMVRDPLSRMISIYYFWGELSKLSYLRKKGLIKSMKSAGRIGSTESLGIIKGTLFDYHGDELTVPPEKVAISFANSFPLTAGMPGPSYTWSLFSDNYRDAVNIIRSKRFVSVVTERLDESLVVLAHHLGWTLADVVITVHRKALSKHPKHSQWPSSAIEILKKKLLDSGEYDVYRAANETLSERIRDMKMNGIDFDARLAEFKQIRTRVTEICLSEEYLTTYKNHLRSEGLIPHHAANKLRDSEDKYTDDGHVFAFNGEILYSYDVCGSCEAHALQLGLSMKLSDDIYRLPTLRELDAKYRHNNVDFLKCPSQ